MKQFNGFPARMEFTSLPNLLFSALLPQITDIAELKTTLHVLAAIYRKRGYPQYVTFRELLGNASLMKSLKKDAESIDEILRSALKMVTDRGTIISLTVDKGEAIENVYLLNSAANRQVVEKLQNGELELKGLEVAHRTCIETEELPDIFTLYEQNIGMLTPIIAEELRDVEKSYPETWIRDAIREAVSLNKRSIRYIVRILENWSAEGKSHGTHQRDSKTDPDKYINQKYGHMVQR
ncbi:DnaD domain-containing protein [Chloroflexota bacterium]